jgi:hypothetical protein
VVNKQNRNKVEKKNNEEQDEGKEEVEDDDEADIMLKEFQTLINKKAIKVTPSIASC